MTGDPGLSPRRRRGVVGVAVLLLAAAVTAIVLSGDNDEDDDPTIGLTIVWGGSEGHPSCVYDPEARTVEAKVTLQGTTSRTGEATVTVTAYADENTSRPVGSGSRTVRVEGTVAMPLLVTIPVTREPHVDIDGETACTHTLEY